MIFSLLSSVCKNGRGPRTKWFCSSPESAFSHHWPPLFMKPIRILIPLLSLAFQAMAATPNTNINDSETTQIIYPEVAVPVNAGAPGQNQLLLNCLRADNLCQRFYLRFDLSAVKGGITGARLRLTTNYWQNPTTLHAFQVYALNENDDSWAEDQITWNNSPAKAADGSMDPKQSTLAGTWNFPAGIGDVASPKGSRQVSFGSDELTQLLRLHEGKKISLVVDNSTTRNSGNSCFFGPKEDDERLRPALEVFTMAASGLAAAPIKTEDVGPSGQVTEGQARFTVITPACIRIEYVPKDAPGGFVDDPTLFAINRKARFPMAKISRSGGVLTINTGRMKLEYHDNGQPPEAGNMSITFPMNSSDAGQAVSFGRWSPGDQDANNLGGPLRTLDNMAGPQPLPNGLLSRSGWALIDDSGKPLLKDGWVRQRPGGMSLDAARTPEMAVNKSLDWYVFAYGHDYKSAFAALKDISGPAAMPRRYTLGSWYCRWFKYSADDFRNIVQEYRDNDFPLDVLVMDMDWHTENASVGYGHAGMLGWTGYTWNKELIPDPKKLLDEFHKDGIFVTLNDHPADGVRNHENVYPSFMKMLPSGTPENPPFDAGNPGYMNAFFQAAHVPIENDGVDFWWVDWQQDYIYPSVLGVPGLPNTPWLNYLYYHHSEAGGRRGQGFSRWGGWGDQRNPSYFSGDARANWDMLAFEVPFTIASGNAGCFFWAHDTGGFAGDRNPETYTRWVQFCALSASLRLHSVGADLDRRPWLWGEPFVTAMRAAFHLRSELMPYIYTSVRECYDQMTPLLRPMYLDFPEMESAYSHKGQYLLGDNLLVAPIVKPAAGTDSTAEQTVWFPPGVWYDYFSGKKFVAGPQGQEQTIRADISQIPLYVRAGVPLVKQMPTLRMTSSPLDKVVVRAFPGVDGATGSSSLYEDDGVTDGYQNNQFARTPIQYMNKGGAIHIIIGPAVGRFAGQLASRAYRIELPGTTPARSVLVNGRPVTSASVTYDSQLSMNRIEIGAFPITQQLDIMVQAADSQN